MGIIFQNPQTPIGAFSFGIESLLTQGLVQDSIPQENGWTYPFFTDQNAEFQGMDRRINGILVRQMKAVGGSRVVQPLEQIPLRPTKYVYAYSGSCD